MQEHVFSFLENAARKWGNKTAVVSAEGSKTFNDLFREAQLFSELILKNCNPSGKGMGFICGNNSLFISGLFGCSASGAVTMPVLPGTKEHEIELLLSQSGINLLVAEKDNAPDFGSKATKKELNEYFNLYIFPEIDSRIITDVFPGAAFIRPSSGTTGQSKGVVISNQAIFERTKAANEGLGIDEECKMLWVMPMAFHFIVSILLYVRYGCCILISADFFASSLISLANKYGATHFYASPLHFRLLVSDTGILKFETLMSVISTSSGLEKEVIENFFEKYRLRIMQAYGIIEIGLPMINSENSGQKDSSIGRPLPAYQVAILDESNMEVKPGVEGAFAIKGPGMFSGYLWPLKRTPDVLVNSWFLTGDIAVRDEDGFIFIKGRSKSMINVSGNKVFPEEVEAILLLHPGIAEARVYRGTHPLTGELVEAQVVLEQNQVLNAEDIITFCRAYLPAYKIPQRLFFTDRIEKTNTGKITRV